MSEANTIQIKLGDFKNPKSTAFTGREMGYNARRIMELDKVDKQDVIVELIIPSHTSSINPSFFLGLFFLSIKEMGISRFRGKFRFSFETDNLDVKRILQSNLEDGLRLASNALELKNPLQDFIKLK